MAKNSNVSADMQFEYPDKNKVACNNCTFREEDREEISGATLGICQLYPDGKPVGILFDNKKCDYYVKE